MRSPHAPAAAWAAFGEQNLLPVRSQATTARGIRLHHHAYDLLGPCAQCGEGGCPVGGALAGDGGTDDVVLAALRRGDAVAHG
ncbi:hypothetical protein ACFC0C_32240 [Streptomyces sp. NPDC056178]|uniref:hypothetical protein n=1 Tax=unclassified Streptomyces TaxID=2593676 RepID=UPI0035D6D3D2